MEFTINNRKWKILEVNQKEMFDETDETDETDEKIGYYYGKCLMYKQIIYLDKDLPFETKRKTLLHELMHCFINCYITHLDKKYEEEDLCDMVANSHDIIHKIVEGYFKNEN